MGVSATDTIPDRLEQVTSLFAKQNLHQVPIEKIKQVPVEERNLALSDLHAVSEPISEDPEFVQRVSLELDDQLERVENKGALLEAVEQSERYVNSWKIRFLRAERFHPERAAERMVRHFETKRSMFGPASLGRDVTVNDLKKEELAALETGCVQALSYRDCGGRAVIAEMGGMEREFPIETMMKLHFLLASLISEDAAVQKDGAVLIAYNIGLRTVQIDRAVKEVENWRSLPLRLVGIHRCYDNAQYHSAMTAASHAMESKYLFRHQCHFGSHAECQGNLTTFGIPRHVLPLFSDGSIDCTHHHRWLKRAQRKAAGRTQHDPMEDFDVVTENEAEVILFAGPKDVVMGRGQRKHLGNQRLRHAVQKHHEKYEGATFMNKRCLCRVLYGQLSSSGTRFIAPTGDGFWERISDEAAIEKISHVFRDYRRELRRKMKNA